jgi:hypothetical protein
VEEQQKHLSEAERRVLRGHAAARMHPVTVRHAAPPRSLWRRWTVITLGWTFLALGIVGLVLPFLQGILFIVIGLALLSREVVWVQRLRERLRERYPKLREWHDEAEAWQEKQWRRIKAYFRSGA